MYQRLVLPLAAIVIAVFVTQPLLGAPISVVASRSIVAATPGTKIAHPLSPSAMFIADRMIELGEAPDSALTAVAELTDDDIAVLAANPKMLQRAGGRMEEAIIIYALIIAGIVVLAANGSGFVSIR